MAAADVYVQFLLSALAYGPEKTRLNAILCLWLIAEGCRKAEQESLTAAEIRAACEDNHVPSGTDWHKAAHRHFALGRSVHGVTGGPGAGKDVGAALDLQLFIHDHARKYGADPVARIRWDLFWEAYKGSLPYREFSVLAAVNAIVGSKSYPVKISRARIIPAAMGYKSIGMMTPEALAARQDKQAPLTVDQLRRTLDGMETRGLFGRIPCANRRGMLFSTRMNAAEMRVHVITHAEKRFGKIAGKSAADQAYLAKVKAIKEGALLKRGMPPATPHTSPAQTPLDTHETPHETPHFNINSLSETLDQKHLIRNVSNIGAVAPCESHGTHGDIEKLERLATEAESVGTPEAMAHAAAYRARIEGLKSASSGVTV